MKRRLRIKRDQFRQCLKWALQQLIILPHTHHYPSKVVTNLFRGLWGQVASMSTLLKQTLMEDNLQ